jgi:hypothetical protein
MNRAPRKAVPIEQTVAALGVLVFLGRIALFAYAGSFARYWADDYCYSAVARDSGLLGSIWDWYRASGNRFSTILMVSISEWFGPHAIRFVPMLVLLAWTAGWSFFLARLARALGWRGAGRWVALAALAQVFYAVLLAPDRLQSVYWRMGTLHYTFPLALLLTNLGWLLGYWQRGNRWPLALASGGLAFLAGGFSETFAAFQTGLLALLLAAGLIGRGRRDGSRASLPLGALVGSLLAMGVMALSPSNAWRQAAMPPPANPIDLITYSLRYAADFSYYSLHGQPLPILVFSATIALISYLALAQHPRRIAAAWALAGIPLSLVLGYGLIVCCVAPSAYAGLLYPAGRALMPARFAFLLGLSGAAICTAAALFAWTQPRRPQRWKLLATLLLLAACAYPMRALPLQRAEIAQMQVKAERFDQRDAQIRAARAQGITNIQVQEVDVVQSLEDLGPDVDAWVNVCARAYYQVSGIWALP